MDQSPQAIAQDQQNIDAALRGDAGAFRKIVEKYQTYIFDLCLRVTRNEQDAADLTQETFLKFYTHLKDYRPGQKLSNWLYTIALNDCRKQLRRRKIARFFSFSTEGTEWEPKAEGVSADHRVRESQTQALLDRMVAGLPEVMRPVFVLRYLEDLTEAEIVQVTGLTVENVRVRLHRARKFLWEKHGDSIKDIL